LKKTLQIIASKVSVGKNKSTNRKR